MNIIKDIAEDFIEENYTDSSHTIKEFINSILYELKNHRKESDKLEFLSIVRNSIQREYDDHYKDCKNRDECDTLKWHAKTIYYVNNILSDYSISDNKNDWFDDVEKVNYSEKLDKIIEQIEILKKGHEIIYDGISEEIDELKNLFYLGKKNWKQITAGKAIEMVVGGIVSETISKELINLTNVTAQNFLK
jgi:hypothetical protein